MQAEVTGNTNAGESSVLKFSVCIYLFPTLMTWLWLGWNKKSVQVNLGTLCVIYKQYQERSGEILLKYIWL